MFAQDLPGVYNWKHKQSAKARLQLRLYLYVYTIASSRQTGTANILTLPNNSFKFGLNKCYIAFQRLRGSLCSLPSIDQTLQLFTNIEYLIYSNFRDLHKSSHPGIYFLGTFIKRSFFVTCPIFILPHTKLIIRCWKKYISLKCNQKLLKLNPLSLNNFNYISIHKSFHCGTNF